MGLLQQIIQSKKEELAETKIHLSLKDLKARLKDMSVEHSSFKKSVKAERGKEIRCIGEIKRASPSAGILRENFDPLEITSIYDTHKGIHAISVITEKRFFMGRLDYLEIVRKKTEKPILRKDFIFDSYQLYESCLYKADAVLLIAATLERSALEDFLSLAKELSLDCLVEVHQLKELDKALYAGAKVVGINNRNLVTFKVDLNRTFHMLPDIPKDKIIVSESGIKNKHDIERLREACVDAVLVGTTMMKSSDIGCKLDELLGR